MAEQTFRSPGFFENEIDLSERRQEPLGTPAGIIGTAERGPAFVPVTVGSYADFERRFGGLSADKAGPYAVREFLKHRSAVTYMRVLGAGANQTTSDIEATNNKGTVANAGFKVSPTTVALASNPLGPGGHKGAVQFICAKHHVSSSEISGFPVFTDNSSFNSSDSDTVNLVRGVVFMASGSRMVIADGNEYLAPSNIDFHNRDDVAKYRNVDSSNDRFGIKIIISSSAGTGFGNDDAIAGARIFSASLDPADRDYIGKVLNTDPNKFQEEEHLLYLDFAVENELATVVASATHNTVVVLSGTANTSKDSGDTSLTNLARYGRFDTRYTTPKTPAIISQPFGAKEYDLFHLETLSDGAAANDEFKVSIANVKASTNPANEFGSFEVQVRRFDDTDLTKQVLESYPNVNLDPSSDRYIARIIGDRKVSFNFDATTEDERRLDVSGEYPNKSALVRVIMGADVKNGAMPKDALPFGFRGIPVIKTNDSLTDELVRALGNGNTHNTTKIAGKDITRLSCSGSLTGISGNISGSIVPPLPYRFKVTRGTRSVAPGFIGSPAAKERVDARLHWGLKVTSLPKTSSLTDAALNANAGDLINPLVRSYTKFMGIQKLDVLVTGSGADQFNDNKFTLGRVALRNNLVTQVTGTAKEHMLEAAYIRNGKLNPTAVTPYSILDGTDDSSTDSRRVTLATLVHSSSALFNKFTSYNKFTLPFYGGFDGLNILDKDAAAMNDRATANVTDGKASSEYTDHGLTTNPAGHGKRNNAVNSYVEAARIMNDPFTVNTNILAIPGIRDPLVTDRVGEFAQDYGKQVYLMDVPAYDQDSVRLFAGAADQSGKRPDAEKTADKFDSRGIDNSYVAAYFPDVRLHDDVNDRVVRAPASTVALGALGFNDKVAYPWFAPAGFNRGSLTAVRNVDVRLSSGDRNTLYDARINPIASFPNEGFVIFGQKTLQIAQSALDRVNVRRMLLEVKRLVLRAANQLVFEQNTPATRQRFVGQVRPLLSVVQAQAGIESFDVVMDETNNTQADVESNRLNGRIVVKPTRSIEHIAIDFVITNSGVIF